MILQKEELTTDISKMLLLGSGSSARKELLNSVGIVPDRVEVPEVDERVKANENPRQYVKRVAIEKAFEPLHKFEVILILCLHKLVNLYQKQILV